jgi:hypothetical protein
MLDAIDGVRYNPRLTCQLIMEDSLDGVQVRIPREGSWGALGVQSEQRSAAGELAGWTHTMIRQNEQGEFAVEEGACPGKRSPCLEVNDTQDTHDQNDCGAGAVPPIT